VIKPMWRLVGMLLVVYLVVVMIVFFRQRAMLFFPTHLALSTGLSPWSDGKQTIGFCHEVTNAPTIWLMMHGNGGQAADRDYVLPCMSGRDSLYVLEYPGYGLRKGSPSLESMNQAAAEAYELLRAQHPGAPVCVLGESLGSGPACALAREKIAPDKIVLVVPFDNLAGVASGHFFFLPVRLMLRDAWDNVESLKHYSGPVEIFAAEADAIIPVQHAKSLAAQIPNAHFTQIPGGHNDWAYGGKVKIRR
jgi:pimeloyl-ACP methyl ester carboxylesterase